MADDKVMKSRIRQSELKSVILKRIDEFTKENELSVEEVNNVLVDLLKYNIENQLK